LIPGPAKPIEDSKLEGVGTVKSWLKIHLDYKQKGNHLGVLNFEKVILVLLSIEVSPAHSALTGLTCPLVH
jgi:hypothetical protein